MSHSPTCSGCPLCNSVFAALVKAPVHEQVQFQRRSATATPPSAPTVAAGQPADVPTAPSLVDAIASRRTACGSRGLIGTVPEPVIYGGGRRRPTVAAGHGDVPEPPSLTDAINRRRQ